MNRNLKSITWTTEVKQVEVFSLHRPSHIENNKLKSPDSCPKEQFEHLTIKY